MKAIASTITLITLIILMLCSAGCEECPNGAGCASDADCADGDFCREDQCGICVAADGE